MSARPCPTTPPANAVLWLVLLLVNLGVGASHLFSVYTLQSADGWLALIGLFARTALFTFTGLLIEGFLLRSHGGFLAASKSRRAILHGFWVLLLLGAGILVIDVFVYGFVGYHVTTAVRILLSDGIEGVGRVVEAGGISFGAVLIGIVAVGVVLAVAIASSKATRRLSLRLGIRIKRRLAWQGLLISLVIVLGENAISYRVRDPYRWDTELARSPLAFAIVRPAARLAEFRVRLRLPKATAPQLDELPALHKRPLPDVYLFVLESLRADVLAPQTMPHVAEFAANSWTFEHAITTGNVTHYSWYGFLCGQYPLYFDLAKTDPAYQGSLPLALLRRMGYRINLLATPDTAYQNMEAVIFGPSGQLLDYRFHPPHKLPATRDRRVIDHLIARIQEQSAGGQFNIIALDSPHFDYAWGPDFEPPFVPFAKSASMARNYRNDAQARELIVNRYKNSVAWADHLVGKALKALSDTGRLANSIVIITGDHGEAFWEHRSGTHGTELTDEQLEIALTMRVPEARAQVVPTVFSMLDIMPTILTQLGEGQLARQLLPGVAVQRILADPSAAARSALTFQGWNERAFRFSLTSKQQRTIFELDRPQPMDARTLSVVDIRDLADRSQVRRGGQNGEYRSLLQHWPQLMKELPFLAF